MPDRPLTQGTWRAWVAVAIAVGSGMLSLGWFSRGAILRSEMKDAEHDGRIAMNEERDKERDNAIAGLIQDYLKVRMDVESLKDARASLHSDLEKIKTILYPRPKGD